MPCAIPEDVKLSIGLEPSTYNCRRRVGAVLSVGIPSAMPGAAMPHIRAYCVRYIQCLFQGTCMDLVEVYSQRVRTSLWVAHLPNLSESSIRI